MIWKYLNHPNIVPFKGITFEVPQLVSEWMPGGKLREYIRSNDHANPITLVSPFLQSSNHHLILSSVVRGCQRSQLSSLVQPDPREFQRSANGWMLFYASAERLMRISVGDILVDATGNAQIVDFGSVTFARDSNSIGSIVEDWNCKSRYSAPEILKCLGQYSQESDVFAFGMVMIGVGGRFTPCETASSLYSGFHWGCPVQ